MANTEEPSQQLLNANSEVLLEKHSKTLNNFMASNDRVFMYLSNLSDEERGIVDRLCLLKGLGVSFCREQRLCVYKMNTEFSKQYQPLLSRKRKNREEPELCGEEKEINDELIKIWISQTLQNFLASDDEVYDFEANLSPEECVAVQQLSQKMGFRVENSGSGTKLQVSVHKIKNKINTTTILENLHRFSFSEESKRVLGGLLMRYPPGDEEIWGDMIGAYSDTTNRMEQKEDDFFSQPCMSKVEITKKLEDLSARMKNSSALKLIAKKRSKLPITSLKDVIPSTVESNQVVIICGETGCGKSTQVPQYILDHMWHKGEVCKIVCTQPQCISAASVSEKISGERGETVGNTVGYKLWFEKRGGRQSSIVLCTTGVLLKVLVSTGSHFLKTQSVKDNISSISHIIMDEIHERDRYSDLMLAILRELLPSNPHLRLILMSASVDAARFSQYFGACPIIHVPGLTYPVKTHYLEDVLSIVKSRAYSYHDKYQELNQAEKMSLDEAIDFAWYNDEWSSLLKLLYIKATPKVFDYQHSLTGLNPLMVFAGKGKVDDMCMLLYLGANCHLRAKDGTTALEIAEKEDQQVAVELLKKHMDNDFSNKEGKNFLDKYLAIADPKVVNVVLIEQLIKIICVDSKDGDIIVYLPGLDEIIKTRERLLSSRFFNRRSRFCVISLHSKVLDTDLKSFYMPLPHGCRKIVLSTNIAESAVTLDDIVYVIDTGLVKGKVYDPYNNVLTLQSSWISKASAKQREGCANRCQPGICYRLYLKSQADSLPDIQVPEIKEMPIEDLCLQVKLLDPSCKIEGFLNRTLDPPGFKSIQNGVRVLKEIGALSVDEQLTKLGEKLGSLPVHPSTSKMILFAILMNCLDPALTLACASECTDLFLHPILPDEKKRAAAARSELASLYGGCGDQLAIIAAFDCWHVAKKMGLESRFCSQYFVSYKSLKRLATMRDKLIEELYRHGLIHGLVSSYRSNAHDPGILQAVLVAGMYPMVGKLFSPHRSGNKFFVQTKSGDTASLNSHSVNSLLSCQKIFDCSLVAYDEITSSDRGMCIRNCTVVGLLPLFLLSKDIAVAPAKDCTEGDEFMSSPDNIVRVTIDGWLNFESTAIDTSLMIYLRERLSAAISYKVTHSTDDVLPPVLRTAVDALACILSCHGLSGIPQTSDFVNTLTTTTNATNPSNQTNQNAPMGLACSTPTKQTDKTPEGFCTALKNLNDVPSSGSSLSTSYGAKNPSDSTCQNTATSAACSVLSADEKDDVTMTDSSPSKDPNPEMQGDASKGASYQKINIAVGWTFPEEGWIKANVDGSYMLKQRHSSCAGAFRDSTGSWCFGFALNLGPLFCRGKDSERFSIQFIIFSELWGIFTALKLAKDKGISKLVIESDCHSAVDAIFDEKAKGGYFSPLIESIIELMDGNWMVRISKCYREGNVVADWLANYAYSLDIGLHVLDVPPSGCDRLVAADSAGVYQLRSVRATPNVKA